MSNAAGPLTTGQLLGGLFEVRQMIERRQGIAGRAFTYLGQQRDLDRPVQIRVLGQPYDPQQRPEAQERFLREARILAHLQHPDVLTIYDMGLTQPDQLPFTVMEWLPGLSLADALAKHGALSPQRALPIFVRCLQVLGLAHAKGVIHRDLTPESLVITHQNTGWERLRIHHFDLIFIDDPDAERLTGTGALVGSPRYMAPEYLMHGKVTPALDVYQMGMILIEMLTGQRLLDGLGKVDCARIHIEEGISIPSALLGGELGPVLTRALSRDPKARYPDAQAFGAAVLGVDPELVFVAQSAPEREGHGLLEGKYQVGDEIGQGGFAVVHEGMDVQTRTPVAIKFLQARPDLRAQQEFVTRFVQEARVALQLNHPNIVKVHHFGVTPEERPYTVMELLEGLDLREHLNNEGPVDAVQAVRWALQALDGLTVAHRQGIVHKDLKPSNLFLHRQQGQPVVLKVLDFGVARMGLEEEARLTRTGQPACTPNYAAPEYITDLTATPALDVYQMGLILIEMITGQTVVVGNVINCVMAHVRGALRLPEAVMGGPLGPLLRKALDVNPAGRYRDAAEFAAALRQVLPHMEPAVVQPDTDPNAATVQVGADALTVAKAFVAALTIYQRSPDNFERLMPLFRTCAESAQWPRDDRKWSQLDEMIQGATRGAAARRAVGQEQQLKRLSALLRRRLGHL